MATDRTPHIQALKDRRAELMREVYEIENELEKPPSKDWEDRSAERQGDEVLEAMGTHDLSELRMIDAALERAASGAFGICTKCGGNISEERLSALPATPFCKTCAHKQEKKN